MKSDSGIIQIKATEQDFPVTLFIMLHNYRLSLQILKTLKCDHSNESY